MQKHRLIYALSCLVLALSFTIGLGTGLVAACCQTLTTCDSPSAAGQSRPCLVEICPHVSGSLPFHCTECVSHTLPRRSATVSQVQAPRTILHASTNQVICFFAAPATPEHVCARSKRVFPDPVLRHIRTTVLLT